ncbi:hypothetical protein SEVIR_9G378350v4 [Setaria viridis]|uniref:Uncharacterized protein n=1 Tax=Setaria viridis TaxID=4556 RepID=A0A4U6TEN2_SETVI|nr:hypothetical protein SEVIR_9G378350v2 [Setaria viridis]
MPTARPHADGKSRRHLCFGRKKAEEAGRPRGWLPLPQEKRELSQQHRVLGAEGVVEQEHRSSYRDIMQKMHRGFCRSQSCRSLCLLGVDMQKQRFRTEADD